LAAADAGRPSAATTPAIRRGVRARSIEAEL
jgi:hypothetical protein